MSLLYLGDTTADGPVQTTRRKCITTTRDTPFLFPQCLLILISDRYMCVWFGRMFCMIRILRSTEEKKCLKKLELRLKKKKKTDIFF